MSDFTVVVEILLIDILLSSDNAVVIALISEGLPEKKRKIAVAIGVFVAIFFRIIFLFLALRLLKIPGFCFFSSFVLCWTGYSLTKKRQKEMHKSKKIKKDKPNFFRVIYLIVLSDLIISIDNVLAIASVASHDIRLFFVGVLISIPMVIFLSAFFLRILQKYPLFFWVGVSFLGFIAGKMLILDVALIPYISHNKWNLSFLVPLFFTVALPLVCFLVTKGALKKTNMS